jgi:transcriptional regulator with XRE-family HTH domain
MPDTTFPARLKELRERAGLTQAELAAAVGTSQGNLSDWESGRREPNLSSLRALAAALKVKPARLIS